MTVSLRTLAFAGALGVAALGHASAASADTVIALIGGKSLAMVDPKTAKITGKVDVTGAADLVGIDVRPSDGMLYGLTAAGEIVTIDPKTGTATKKSTLSEKLASAKGVTVDFNPAADRMRILTPEGVSLRVNVDDGKATVDGALKFAEADMHKGEKPNVVAGAYTNAVNGKKAEKTDLYDIDATIPALVKQAPPNDGVLSAVGKIGVTLTAPVAFEIVSGESGNVGWLMTGDTLYSMDLSTGKTALAGKIAGAADVTDIAWWPAM